MERRRTPGSTSCAALAEVALDAVEGGAVEWGVAGRVSKADTRWASAATASEVSGAVFSSPAVRVLSSSRW